MLDKRVTRLVKAEDGSGRFERIVDTGDVIKLAGRPGAFDLTEEYGVPAKLVEALDVTSQLAMAAGLDALREAGLPLVQTYRRTSTGRFLPDRWLLPEPLRKPAGEALATSVETPLPMGSGDILVNLGQRIALRARSANGQTGVRIALGSSRVDEAAPANGLVATGRAQALDAIDWIALLHGGEGDGLPLQRIDVVTQKLNLLGGVAVLDGLSKPQLEGFLKKVGESLAKS